MDHNIGNLLVVCDVDGTLMRAGMPIPERNVEMIARFREHGGNFTICTGRGIQASRKLINDLGINIPAILCNGGLIYDYGSEKILSQSILDIQYKELIKDFVTVFPEIGYEVVSGNDIYVPQNNEIINHHLYVNNMEYKMMPIEKITADANKILIGADEDTISRMKMYYNVVSYSMLCLRPPRGHRSPARQIGAHEESQKQEERHVWITRNSIRAN